MCLHLLPHLWNEGPGPSFFLEAQIISMAPTPPLRLFLLYRGVTTGHYPGVSRNSTCVPQTPLPLILRDFPPDCTPPSPELPPLAIGARWPDSKSRPSSDSWSLVSSGHNFRGPPPISLSCQPADAPPPFSQKNLVARPWDFFFGMVFLSRGSLPASFCFFPLKPPIPLYGTSLYFSGWMRSLPPKLDPFPSFFFSNKALACPPPVP